MTRSGLAQTSLTLLVILVLSSAATAGDSFFAATGVWAGDKAKGDELDPVAAAKAATKDMMVKFAAAGMKPQAVIFLERVKVLSPEQGKVIGDAVKEVARGAAVFGHGGTGTYGVVMADVADKTPTFMVIGLAGENLSVTGYLSKGAVKYMYPSKATRDKAAGGDKEAQALIDRERSLRATCSAKGKALGKMIPALVKPGFVMVTGALHNNWHVNFAEGLAEAVGAKTPIIGGVGKWADYVYCDGENSLGQMAVVVQGDLKLALAGVKGANTWKKAVLQTEMGRIHKRTAEQLGKTRPEALLTFSCVTRMRNPKLNPSDKLKDLRALWGEDVEIFGGFCGGEIGRDLKGELTVGGDRLTVVAIAGKDK